MNDAHKLELLKALREHGQTIQKMAAGGMTQPGMVTAFSDPTPLAGPTQSGTTGRTRSGGLGGAISDVLGAQTDFQASGAPIQSGTNVGQLQNAYEQAQGGIGAQQQFLNALQAQNGIQNQGDVYRQYQDVAAGRGPNPAQAMLNNQTGQNVANQAALMASARGANANPGMVARLAAQQGAQTQQNAIGQAAALQAQQQLGALNNLAGISQNQVNQYGQAVQGLNTAAQNEQNILQGANSAYNQANVGMQSNLNNVNAQIAQGNQNASNSILGGLAGSLTGPATKILGSLFGAEGGQVEIEESKYDPVQTPETPTPENGPKSNVGKYLKGIGASAPQGIAGFANAIQAKQGGTVPGHAKVGGAVNTEKNDTVPAMLSAGEIVLPRSVTKSDDPAGNAAKFVAAIMAKKGRMPGKAA